MTRRLPPGVLGPLPDGRFYGTVEGPRRPDGKRNRPRVYGRTAREVADKLAGLRRRVEDGGLTSGPGTATGAWLDHWLATIAGPSLRPRTREKYAWAVAAARPHLGGVPLAKLAPEHLEACYAALSRTLAPSSVHSVHRVLKTALRVAEERRRVTRSPAELARAPKVPHKEMAALSGGEVPAVLAAAAASVNGARWLFALAMGARQGEVLGLTWDRLDLDAGVVDLALQLQRTGREWHLVDVKSAAGRRRLPLPAELVPILREHRRLQLERRIALGSAWVGSTLGELVFPTALGAPVHRSVDRKQWLAVLDAAGVRRVRVHDARHTAATLMLEAGIDVKVVAAWLGHSQVAMSHQYQHVTARLEQDASARIGAALWPGVGG